MYEHNIYFGFLLGVVSVCDETKKVNIFGNLSVTHV